jgi:SARP family transcriptional regulator, regulator of embCAB operon
VGQSWRLRLLGSFDLVGSDGSIVLRPVEERVIALLTLEARAVSREVIASKVCTTERSAKTSAALRTTLWRIRKAAPGLLQHVHDRIALSETVESDLAHVRCLARTLLKASSAPTPDCIERLSRDLLPDWYDDWVTLEQERFRQTRLHALEAVARRFIRQGCYAEAIDAATLAIKAEPLRESAHRTLIAVHVAEGNAAEASRQYDRFKQLFTDEFGPEVIAGQERMFVTSRWEI